ncbi:transglutaminase domain-containing protein [Nocardiopsis sp. HNM0947]|uniref:Transglutaminase domain-containing protein n=1 Tax=Nocardiopsis coralli TaxID=2772213 RepID=A0ABR9P0J5_9ACTN|nr:DUF3488 and transglutaminase-like domain-containing protein [Nocardiopsis coralli]MBE2997368.1 transglutaminase domain-containing protein [Nocardiopsis coralli]
MPLVTLLCLVTALPLLAPLLSGDGWWVPALVLMAAASAVSALYRLSGWNAAPVPLLQALLVFLLLTPLFAAHTAPLGVIPNGESVGYLVQLFTQGTATINDSSVPVSANAGITLIIALTFVVFVMVADFLAVTARCAGMVGGLLLTLMAVPLVVDPAGLELWQALWCAAGYVALLAADTWTRRRAWGTPVPSPAPGDRVLAGVRRAGTAALAGAAAVLMAVTLPLAVPSLRTDAFYDLADGSHPGFGEDMVTTTHPLVSMRRELGSDSDSTVLTYRTDAEEPDYLRTYVLDRFDGENWTMDPVDATDDNTAGGDLPLPTGWSSEASGPTTTTQVSMSSSTPRPDFLPLPYWARSVDVSGQWHVDPDTHTVFTTGNPPTGLSFTVESNADDPTAEELADAGRPRSLASGHLDVPEDVDPQVQELTDRVTEDAGSPYEAAVALQDHFDDFTYSLQPPAVPEGNDPLAHFLFEDRIGYCEQFAGAMALMARQADIPARVAVGYTQGERTNGDRWVVSSADAHAWPELYFEGAGWVRFEPTPSGGSGQGSASVPEHADPSGEGGQDEGSPSPSPSPSPSESPSPTDGPGAEETQGPDEESAAPDPEEDPGSEAAGGGSGSEGGPALSWLPYVGGFLVALALLALPALARSWVRAARRSALAGAPASAAHAAWREVRDTHVDLGLAWDLSESPRATAGRTQLPEEARWALWRLALAEEAARYAPDPVAGGQLREDLRTVRSALCASVGRGARMRAVLLPRSLAPWHRPRPEPLPAT